MDKEKAEQERKLKMEAETETKNTGISLSHIIDRSDISLTRHFLQKQYENINKANIYNSRPVLKMSWPILSHMF